ncbi:uncharacterized protein LOC142776432 isoform X3 [Rhipicephalus microplus]|uniref:uncharacterized protein LOC142776432 isoform X3 n=1 Tax=Rhipicephalus microplus TaxID=6941 RepID=UPI003F6C6725
MSWTRVRNGFPKSLLGPPAYCPAYQSQKWSTKGHRFFGPTGTVWLEVVCLASCKAPDTRSTEQCVCRLDFTSVDEVFDPNGQKVVETSLAFSLLCLLTGLVEPTGVYWLAVGRAALAAPTRRAGGFNLGMLGVAAKGHCGARLVAPLLRRRFLVRKKARLVLMLQGTLHFR